MPPKLSSDQATRGLVAVRHGNSKERENVNARGAVRGKEEMAWNGARKREGERENSGKKGVIRVLTIEKASGVKSFSPQVLAYRYLGARVWLRLTTGIAVAPLVPPDKKPATTTKRGGGGREECSGRLN